MFKVLIICSQSASIPACSFLVLMFLFWNMWPVTLVKGDTFHFTPDCLWRWHNNHKKPILQQHLCVPTEGSIYYQPLVICLSASGRQQCPRSKSVHRPVFNFNPRCLYLRELKVFRAFSICSIHTIIRKVPETQWNNKMASCQNIVRFKDGFSAPIWKQKRSVYFRDLSSL